MWFRREQSPFIAEVWWHLFPFFINSELQLYLYCSLNETMVKGGGMDPFILWYQALQKSKCVKMNKSLKPSVSPPIIVTSCNNGFIYSENELNEDIKQMLKV